MARVATNRLPSRNHQRTAVAALNMGRRALALNRVLLRLVVRWSNPDVRAPVPCGRLSTIIRRFTLHRGHRCITIRATVLAGLITHGAPAMNGAYISSFLETNTT